MLVLILGAGLAYSILHGLWLVTAAVVAVGALVGWLGYKAMKKS